MSRPAVSQHLKVLKLAGLVREGHEGTRHVYSIDEAGLESVRAYFESFWERSLTAFKAAAERPESQRSAEKETP